MIQIESLLDPSSALIVFGGTLFATILRSGRLDLKACALAYIYMTRKPFDYDAVRAEIAHDIADIQNDGLYRAQPVHSSDEEISEATAALIRSRSLQAAIDTHESHKKRRERVRQRAINTLTQAADLAPVFGLAGTLISLSQLPAKGLDQANLMPAIGMAVVSTFYGLMLGHIIIMPIAKKIERSGDLEEYHRERLINWMVSQLKRAEPPQTRAAESADYPALKPRNFRGAA